MIFEVLVTSKFNWDERFFGPFLNFKLWVKSKFYLNCGSRHAPVDSHQRLRDSSSSYATWQIAIFQFGAAFFAVDATHARKFVNNKAIPADSFVAGHARPQASLIFH
jgi:hypothetical protein